MVNYNLLTGQIKEDFNGWVKTNNEFIFEGVHKDMSLIEWLDSLGIYIGVFAGMYDSFNWNIQVKGTWKKWVSESTYNTRKEAYNGLLEKVIFLYNEGHLISMPSITYDGTMGQIEISEKIFNFEPLVDYSTYIIGIDTYDKDSRAYSLCRKIGDRYEIILNKKLRDENEFNKDVEALSRYFNADILKEGVFIPKKHENIDIKYLGIPNVCFSLTKKDDKREKVYSQQRIERGFDDTETWSLSGTLASFLLPRLKRFNELDNCEREEEYQEDMKNFITLLELEIRDEGSRDFSNEEDKQIDKGLKAFERIFFRLWW